MEISLASEKVTTTSVRTVAEVDQLLRDVRPWLYRLALAVTAHPEIAEDAAQDALIRANRSRHKLMAVTEPRAWLRTVVVRCALTRIQRAPPFPDIPPEISQDPLESIAVQQTLQKLSAHDRVLLGLVHFEGLTYSEIAEIMAIPVGTVASRLHSARQAFREEWNK